MQATNTMTHQYKQKCTCKLLPKSNTHLVYRDKEEKQEAAKKACKESRTKLTKLEDAISKASDELSQLVSP